jgi:hypothetical protein
MASSLASTRSGSVWVLGKVTGIPMHIPPSVIAAGRASVLVPLAAGIVVRRLPSPVVSPANVASTVVLVGAMIRC